MVSSQQQRFKLRSPKTGAAAQRQLKDKYGSSERLWLEALRGGDPAAEA